MPTCVVGGILLRRQIAPDAAGLLSPITPPSPFLPIPAQPGTDKPGKPEIPNGGPTQIDNQDETASFCALLEEVILPLGGRRWR